MNGLVVVLTVCLFAACIPFIAAMVWIDTHFTGAPDWASSGAWVYSLSGGFFVGALLLLAAPEGARVLYRLPLAALRPPKKGAADF